MNKEQKILSYLLGGILILFGVYLSIFQKHPHFYTFFSIGFLMIFWTLYNSISKKKLFDNFKTKHQVFFWITLTILCIIIDKIGIFLGYWIYPNFNSVFDEILKYLFEWVLPLTTYMILFLIGLTYKAKEIKLKNILFGLALVLIFGFFTEFINLFSLSWEILSMPITNFKIGPFFLVFNTIGYLLMILIPLGIYTLIEKYLIKLK